MWVEWRQPGQCLVSEVRNMKTLLPLLYVVVVAAGAGGRRVRVRPEESEETPLVEYYPEGDDQPVLLARQESYGRATGQPRQGTLARARPETARAPPVQTIRNYNKLNDDGSFTFGYEAADGSFKEETRGTDCVVRGKYGYVDPDGNKREFTYVSGNPCDPNAVSKEEEESNVASAEDSLPENVPANYPRRHPKPVRPVKPSRPATTLFQQNYDSQESPQQDEETVPVTRPQLLARPVYRPTYNQLEDEIQPTILRATPRPKAAYISQPTPKAAIRITPRPSTTELPATTYRPQLLQVSSPAPPSYTKQLGFSPSTTPSNLGFEEEFKKFQIENNVVSTPRPASTGSKPLSSDPIYSSELVFDPASGQYNTVLFQQIPHTSSEFNFRGRIQPYVGLPQNYYQPRPQFLPSRPLDTNYQQQQLYEQQQATLLQQSQQLFAQQQQRKQENSPQGRSQSQRFPPQLLQQEPQRFQPQPQRFPAAKAAVPPPQRFSPFPQQQNPINNYYYVAPQDEQRPNFAAGQIDAFLRGHSLTI